jgi:hypothetical protein
VLHGGDALLIPALGAQDLGGEGGGSVVVRKAISDCRLLIED